MKDIYMLDYPTPIVKLPLYISLELFDYEDMTLSFNKDIWNLVIEFDEDEERYFVLNDKMNT